MEAKRVSAVKNKEIYFPQLDIVRFIAALMIIILHSYETWCGWFGELPFFSIGKDKGVKIIGKYVENFIENFRLGVDIFFLISGFLITYLLLKEKGETGTISIKKFFGRRILRIWPLYYLLIALSPLMIYWLGLPSPDYTSTVLFINNFHTISTHAWTFPFDHFWSICIEEHFYLIWPFIILWVPRKKLLPVLYSLLAFSITYRIWIIFTVPNPQLILYLNTFCRMDVLIMGAVIAYYYYKTPFTINTPGIVRLLIYCILILALCIDLHFNNPLFEEMKRYIYIGLITFTFLNYNFNPDARLKFKNNKLIHYLGKISYGLYMYSNIILIITIKKFILPFNFVNIYLYIILMIGLPIIISTISYELFERPFLKIKRHLETIKTIS